MKARGIMATACALIVLLGCSTTRHFVKLEASQSDFREACKACKEQVRILHPASHGQYRRYNDISSPRGAAADGAVNSAMGAGVELARAVSGHTWKDAENFEECMQRRGWILMKRGGEGASSVRLSGSWQNMTLEYIQSD